MDEYVTLWVLPLLVASEDIGNNVNMTAWSSQLSIMPIVSPTCLQQTTDPHYCRARSCLVCDAGGWVKTGRKQGKDTFAFLEVNDGSSRDNLQLMVTAETYDITKLVVSTATTLLSWTTDFPTRLVARRSAPMLSCVSAPHCVSST